MSPFPGCPVYTISVGSMASIQVLAIQIGRMTPPIPPSTMIQSCTIA